MIIEQGSEVIIPIYGEFMHFCEDLAIEYTPAMLANFQTTSRGKSLKFSQRAYSLENFCWRGSPTELRAALTQWYMEYTMEDPATLAGYLSIGQAAELLGIKSKVLATWLWTHSEYYEIHKGHCVIKENVIQNLHNQWKTVCIVPKIILPLLYQIPPKMRITVKTEILAQLQISHPSWILPPNSFPQQQKNILYTVQPLVAEKELNNSICSYAALPLNCLKDITGMDISALREKCSCGAINAVDDNGILRISVYERQRVEHILMQYIVIDDIIQDCLSCCNSKFRHHIQYDRNNLLSFCEENNWWGIHHTECKNLPVDGKKFDYAICREDAGNFNDHIQMWIWGYQQPAKIKFGIVVDILAKKHPKTAKKLSEFENKCHPADAALVDMTQLLYVSLSSELGDMHDREIEATIVSRFFSEATIAACEMLNQFLSFGGYTNRSYLPDRTGIEIDTAAYSAEAFGIMICHVVNENTITHKNLIVKATENKRYADLWLYVALHIFSAWRSTDYVRMIAPILPHTPEETLEKAKNHELTKEEAVNIAEYFIASNCLHLSIPNKTKNTAGVSDLYFFCPQSCLEPFGKILAIATAHYQLCTNADNFVIPVNDWLTIKRFFGDIFLQACGNRAFSGRRANKALLQSVEFAGREEEQLPPLVAYHLASIMRSHKINYGSMSETTDIYLHDAAFSGLTPEYVIFQMWERGVCSFVTDAMLRICYGEQYSRLSVIQQTQAIKELGLTPAEIANTLACVQNGIDRAHDIVMAEFQDNLSIEKALKNMALGNGTGKFPDVFCLLKASGKTCLYKAQADCKGCKFEILTKATLLRYASAYQQLSDTNLLSEKEKARRKYLCNTVLWPKLVEILTHIDTDKRALYKNLIQEVSQYAITSNYAP